MNHELKDNAEVKFCNNETLECPDLCDEKIFEECLKEVFAL